jgi:putative tryptophan/tyrosine transport system substrate-binding protein
LRIPSMAEPFGLIALLISVLMLRQDGIAPPRTITVLYLGAKPQAQDRTFMQFAAAVHKLAPPAGSPLTLRYLQGDALDAAGMGAAIAGAGLVPDLLVAPTAASAMAAKGLTSAPAIVFASAMDPVEFGIVPSLLHPGRRITGISLADDLHVKRLELLRDAFPAIQRVAILADQGWAEAYAPQGKLKGVVALAGLHTRVLLAETREELDALMHSDAAAWADGWYIPPTYISYLAESEIIEHLRRLHRPAMHSDDSEMAAGALMAYSRDMSFAYDALARLTLRVAAGEDAGSIPIQQPMRFVLSVRPRQGDPQLRIQPDVIRRADRVY